MKLNSILKNIINSLIPAILFVVLFLFINDNQVYQYSFFNYMLVHIACLSDLLWLNKSKIIYKNIALSIVSLILLYVLHKLFLYYNESLKVLAISIFVYYIIINILINLKFWDSIKLPKINLNIKTMFAIVLVISIISTLFVLLSPYQNRIDKLMANYHNMSDFNYILSDDDIKIEYLNKKEDNYYDNTAMFSWNEYTDTKNLIIEIDGFNNIADLDSKIIKSFDIPKNAKTLNMDFSASATFKSDIEGSDKLIIFASLLIYNDEKIKFKNT